MYQLIKKKNFDTQVDLEKEHGRLVKRRGGITELYKHVLESWPWDPSQFSLSRQRSMTHHVSTSISPIDEAAHKHRNRKWQRNPRVSKYTV